MYRSDDWFEGYYIDNHKKYECMSCEKQFIVGEELLKDCPPRFPVCPYCGQSNVECVSWTEDDQLEELSSDLGCLAIHVQAGMEEDD
jgi:DNA-directed RNA polymerase subunit RPC12/RpoP